MRVADLCAAFQALGFPGAAERTHPERDLVLAARPSVEAAVRDDEFLADCISAELELIESNRVRRGLVPFSIMPGLGIRVAFGYWGPGTTAGPHEHTAWTISAVCRNELEVLTYNRVASYEQGRLVPKNHFQAPAGKVGFLSEPCIHEPKNTSTDWSLSLHVTSPRDGEWPGDYDALLPGLNVRRRLAAGAPRHPYAGVVAARRRNRCVHQLARILASMTVAQAPALLERCAALGCRATRDLADEVRGERRSGAPLRGQDEVLVRTHQDLALRVRRVGDTVALVAETPHGPVEDFVIDEVARDAVAFVTTAAAFQVAQMPGNLSGEERVMIADGLVESGLFSRRAQNGAGEAPG